MVPQKAEHHLWIKYMMIFVNHSVEGAPTKSIVLPGFKQFHVIEGFVWNHCLSLAAFPLPPPIQWETEVRNGFCSLCAMVTRYQS